MRDFGAKERPCLALPLLLKLSFAPLRAVCTTPSRGTGWCWLAQSLWQDREPSHAWLPAEGRVPPEASGEQECGGLAGGRPVPQGGGWEGELDRLESEGGEAGPSGLSCPAGMPDGQSQGLLLGLESLSPCPKSVGAGAPSRVKEEPRRPVPGGPAHLRGNRSFQGGPGHQKREKVWLPSLHRVPDLSLPVGSLPAQTRVVA